MDKPVSKFKEAMTNPDWRKRALEGPNNSESDPNMAEYLVSRVNRRGGSNQTSSDSHGSSAFSDTSSWEIISRDHARKLNQSSDSVPDESNSQGRPYDSAVDFLTSELFKLDMNVPIGPSTTKDHGLSILQLSACEDQNQMDRYDHQKENRASLDLVTVRPFPNASAWPAKKQRNDQLEQFAKALKDAEKTPPKPPKPSRSLDGAAAAPYSIGDGPAEAEYRMWLQNKNIDLPSGYAGRDIPSQGRKGSFAKPVLDQGRQDPTTEAAFQKMLKRLNRHSEQAGAFRSPTTVRTQRVAYSDPQCFPRGSDSSSSGLSFSKAVRVRGSTDTHSSDSGYISGLSHGQNSQSSNYHHPALPTVLESDQGSFNPKAREFLSFTSQGRPGEPKHPKSRRMTIDDLFASESTEPLSSDLIDYATSLEQTLPAAQVQNAPKLEEISISNNTGIGLQQPLNEATDGNMPQNGWPVVAPSLFGPFATTNLPMPHGLPMPQGGWLGSQIAAPPSYAVNQLNMMPGQYWQGGPMPFGSANGQALGGAMPMGAPNGQSAFVQPNMPALAAGGHAPVSKPREPDTSNQQRYEAWIEYRKANEPGYALQCKLRQQRRAQKNANKSKSSSNPSGSADK